MLPVKRVSVLWLFFSLCAILARLPSVVANDRPSNKAYLSNSAGSSPHRAVAHNPSYTYSKTSQASNPSGQRTKRPFGLKAKRRPAIVTSAAGPTIVSIRDCDKCRRHLEASKKEHTKNVRYTRSYTKRTHVPGTISKAYGPGLPPRPVPKPPAVAKHPKQMVETKPKPHGASSRKEQHANATQGSRYKTIVAKRVPVPGRSHKHKKKGEKGATPSGAAAPSSEQQKTPRRHSFSGYPAAFPPMF
eukprot:Selendium_serpulae@DN6143_c2_g5_i1.p1